MNGKKIIKPFDLEAAKKGAKVETRDGDKVEILKWDANSDFPLMGVYEDEGCEYAGCWALNGEWGGTPGLDLVIVEYGESEEQKEEINSVEDRVGHPSYYTSHPSGVECIDITRHYCFDIGNAIKYLWRAGLKKEEGISNRDKEIEDLEKAIWYIKDHIESLRKQNK